MNGRRHDRMTRMGLVALVLLIGSAPFEAAEGQSLRGSKASIDRQNQQAKAHDFTFLATGTQVRRFVDSDYLVPVRPTRDFDIHDVTFPYARPEVDLFIRRLASQYRAGCGEKLVVTSLTRPQNNQPGNASDRSVHPTGMALDLRRSNSPRCRAWLENVLVGLEREGVLEATRESRPPHYHVAVFPSPYKRYVANLTARDSFEEAKLAASRVASNDYRVRRGDSLWTIARAHGTTVDDLKAANDLASSTIYPGQVIAIPVAR